MKMRKQRDRNIIQFFNDLRKFTKIYNAADKIQYDIKQLLFTVHFWALFWRQISQQALSVFLLTH